MEPLDLFARREILSVSQLVGRIKKQAEAEFDFVWVEGEVGGLRRPASGHYYFNLKDDRSILRAVLFRHQAALLRFQLEEGQQVLCQGRVTVYEARGDLQMVVDAVEPRGSGSLALAFEQLKARLDAEGLFAASRKRPLPELPTRVAVVTSPSGAAIRDFLSVLHRRFEPIQVAVYPVQVQGAQAAPQMVQALADLAQWGWPQVIVLTRGGGSVEDLWAFNDEALARAMAACPIPIVSAVGHEVDFTIADFVADLRAPTPSAAAELLVKDRLELSRRLTNLSQRLTQAGQRMVERRRLALTALARGLGDPRRRLADRRLRVDDLVARIKTAQTGRLQSQHRALANLLTRLTAARPDRQLARLAQRWRELRWRLETGERARLAALRGRLDGLEARLGALSPLGVLGRGYALAQDEQGRVLRQAAQARPGQRLGIRLGQGRLWVRVEEVES